MPAHDHKATRYVKAPELMRIFRVGRKKLADAIAAGAIPPPVTLGPRCRLWDLEQVRLHMATRASEEKKRMSDDDNAAAPAGPAALTI